MIVTKHRMWCEHDGDRSGFKIEQQDGSNIFVYRLNETTSVRRETQLVVLDWREARILLRVLEAACDDWDSRINRA